MPLCRLVIKELGLEEKPGGNSKKPKKGKGKKPDASSGKNPASTSRKSKSKGAPSKKAKPSKKTNPSQPPVLMTSSRSLQLEAEARSFASPEHPGWFPYTIVLFIDEFTL